MVCVLGIVLASGVGCGRAKPLAVPNGAMGDAGLNPSDVPPRVDGGTIEDAVPGALDAPGGPDADGPFGALDTSRLDAPVEVDAPVDVFRPDGGRVPYRAIAVATGEYHACALLDDHRVKCWGDNNAGQLGLGDAMNRGDDSSTMGDNLPTVDLGTGRTATAIAASRYASCAILDDQTVKCWGNNIGTKPGEMGDHLAALDFGGRKAVNVAMGEYTECASMDDDTIWCWWGSCPTGGDWTPCLQSGPPLKPVKALGPADNGVVAIYEDGTLSPVLPSGGALPDVPPGRKVVAVAGGQASESVLNVSACVLLDDGTTICLPGVTGNNIGPANAIAIGVMRVQGLCSAFSDGSVSCQHICLPPYQCSSDGSFLLGSPAVTVTSNGNFFACALSKDGDIKCWEPSGAFKIDHLGAEFDSIQTDGGSITGGVWHAVDLGTHP
jgi:hypothetical protein